MEDVTDVSSTDPTPSTSGITDDNLTVSGPSDHTSQYTQDDDQISLSSSTESLRKHGAWSNTSSLASSTHSLIDKKRKLI